MKYINYILILKKQNNFVIFKFGKWILLQFYKIINYFYKITNYEFIYSF
ncbi:hypothetical protein SRH_03795 [Mesomycoplasma hyorhinis MCLD]|uniref:Uncharacterized protein n=1 Tax=Mesomycoplasma hyorhinis (strain MCLD) TaxID=936139 RepID=A0ABM5M768_MESHM|nr:hypothetical protein SRH_03795 [Mesomycoplasma hyorhinis MCLD]